MHSGPSLELEGPLVTLLSLHWNFTINLTSAISKESCWISLVSFQERLKLSPTEGLAKGPVWRSHIGWDNRAAIACCHLEREGLAIEVCIALPVLAPIARHRLPPSSRPFNGGCHYITSTTNICYEHQVEVWVAINGEPDPTTLPAGNPGSRKYRLVCDKFIGQMDSDWNVLVTSCIELGLFLLYSELCVGKQAAKDRNVAEEDYTSLQHCLEGHCLEGKSLLQWLQWSLRDTTCCHLHIWSRNKLHRLVHCWKELCLMLLCWCHSLGCKDLHAHKLLLEHIKKLFKQLSRVNFKECNL